MKIKRIGKIKHYPCSSCNKKIFGLNSRVKCSDCKYNKKHKPPYLRKKKDIQIVHWNDGARILRLPKETLIKDAIIKAGYIPDDYQIMIFRGNKNSDGNEKIERHNKLFLEPKK